MAWQPWQRSRGQPPPPQIIADALAGTPDASVSAFRTAVQSLMQTPGLTLDAMQHQVHHLAVEHFPARRAPEATKSCQDVQLQGYAARMWSHFHAYRKLRSLGSGATLSVLFRAWHHRALYHSMRAAAKKRSAELRKLRRDRLFATARTAAINGNLREFYKVVRLLAPQGSKRRFQLCQGGAPLPPERELAIMQKHFEEQFASHNASLATHEPWECDDPVLVTVAEVQWHLDKLPARKAGAPSTSPGAVWRLCSDLVSPFMAQQLSDRWGQGRKCVPHLWTTATLALLLKAGKNGSEPKHFRPIGLLDALGKSCISMVLHKIKSDLEAFVRTAPQFSYIAGRSTEDALRRVFYHCAEARQLREAHARNPHQRFAGLRMPSWQGGVQICLDLASAFDTVPHGLVREALCEAGVAEGPASLLFAWLSSCSYDLHLSGLSASIPARRGGTVVEFEHVCERIGVAIGILRRHGLTIHPAKAQALLTYAGSKAKQTRRRFTRPLPSPAEGKGLRLRAEGEEILLPLVRRADYLGAVISYDCFSSQTLDRRLAQGRTAHVQLRKVLNARKGLLLTQRVLLWRTTVWPCMLYGLGACGLTASHLASLQILALKQLRALSCSPAHIHHESDAALCLRLGVPLPKDALRHLSDKALLRQDPNDPFVLGSTHPWALYLQSCWACGAPACPVPASSSPVYSGVPPAPPPGLVPPDCSHPDPLPSLPLTVVPSLLPCEDSLDVVEPEPPACADVSAPNFPCEVPSPPAASLSFPCPLCTRLFDARKSLKLHMARTHKQHTTQVVFDRARHALHGLPTCAFCHKDFTRWEGLSAHIMNRRCAQFPQTLVFHPPDSDLGNAPAAPTSSAPAEVFAASPACCGSDHCSVCSASADLPTLLCDLVASD